ncbi:hypothetical protein EXS65_02250 [Candidatus Peribacteria bacterium]|nr:hypothetical protein [Candidatus Peribacteria bacterium]
MKHESILSGRSEHLQGKHPLPPSRHSDMSQDFLPIDENAWQADFQPEFHESAESVTGAADAKTSTVEAETKLFRRRNQFLLELSSPNEMLKFPKYLAVSRADAERGYTLQFRDVHPADEEGGIAENAQLFRNREVLTNMRRAESPQEALSVLRKFFREKGIELTRINS